MPASDLVDAAPSGTLLGDDGLSLESPPDAIAVIGMGCRFPGAADLEAYRLLLEAGASGRHEVTDEDLIREGVDAQLPARRTYVRACYPLEDFDRFDAAFFGVTADEAALLDPQQRVFLEVAWHALEDAGLDLDRTTRNIGVFAGSNISTYLLFNLLPRFSSGRPAEGLEMLLANDKDYVATRLAYRLDLKGPAVTVQTACSTSLVAVCQACDALLNYACDAALAGGVAIRTPHKVGYVFEPGGVYSPDGECRPFDRRGEGTVFSNGAGLVVLKRLADAIEDGDRIHAVIRGFATNNDGGGKAGFTAPSVSGQAQVIQAALDRGEIDPATIGYVEAHGTGTPLGDPIEIAALTRVLGVADRAAPCLIGSVKSNIGHCDSAAGVAGLIKAILAVSGGRIPPSLNFTEPNPRLRLETTPFEVCTALSPWPGIAGPRRAGVSSFGIGGTNAHVVLEQAPATAPAQSALRPWRTVVCTARSEAASDAAVVALIRRLERVGAERFPHLAASTIRHRTPMRRRVAVVARTPDEAASLLARGVRRDGAPFRGEQGKDGSNALCLMFSGQIPLRRGIGRGLIRSEPVFRRALHDSIGALEDRDTAKALRHWFRVDARVSPPNLDWWSPVATFCLQYALSRMWTERGVRPDMVLGHSLGEYAAAVAAGVMDLVTAVNAVRERSWLMHFRTAPGAMLLVNASAEAVATWLREDGPSVSISAINGPANVAISGAAEEMALYGSRLAERGVRFEALNVPYAGHSAVMDPMLPEFETWFERRVLRAGDIPMCSTMAGGGLEVDALEYWLAQVRRPVDFAGTLERCVDAGVRNFLEISSTATLSVLGEMRWPGPTFAWAPSMHRDFDEEQQVARAAAQLWVNGCDLDLADPRGLDEPGSYQDLPSYPFDRQRHWRAPPGADRGPSGGTEASVAGEQIAAGKGAGALRGQITTTAADARGDLMVEWLRVKIGDLIGSPPLEGEALAAGFFDLGVTSLKIVSFAAELSDELDVELPSTILFENPTILELADALVELVVGRRAPDEAAASPVNDRDLIGELERVLGEAAFG